MATGSTKNLLIVIRHSPYGSSIAKSSVDTALAAAAFNQPVKLLFLGDGVLQLIPNQDGRAVGAKTLGRQLASLPLYDIETVYADAEAVDRYRLNAATAPVPVHKLTNVEIHQLMSESDHILGF